MTLEIMAGVLVVLVGLCAWQLRKSNADRHSAIYLEDLLLGEDGKISRAACVLLGAFFLTSWMMISMTLAKTMTDVTFAAYLAAWVAPAVTKLIVNGGIEKAKATPPTPEPSTVIGNNVTMNQKPPEQ